LYTDRLFQKSLLQHVYILEMIYFRTLTIN